MKDKVVVLEYEAGAILVQECRMYNFPWAVAVIPAYREDIDGEWKHAFVELPTHLTPAEARALGEALIAAADELAIDTGVKPV